LSTSRRDAGARQVTHGGFIPKLISASLLEGVLTSLFEYGGVKISRLGHDGFKIKNAKTMYIEEVEKTISAKTTIITAAQSKRKLSKK
jgi:hypothetical protein